MAAAVGAMSIAQAQDKAPPGAVHFDVPADPTKEQGRAVAADGGYGSRSQFETEVRWRFPTANENTSWSMTPLDKMLGNLTASGLHFERHHGGIPTIDPARHTMIVHGMVDTPKKFTMADLKRFPSVTRKYFIECSGNGLTEWNKPTLKTVQGTHGLLSTGNWLSAMLRPRPCWGVSCRSRVRLSRRASSAGHASEREPRPCLVRLASTSTLPAVASGSQCWKCGVGRSDQY